MRTAFGMLTSTIPRFFIWLDPQAIHQLVKPAEEINHLHELEQPFVIQSQLMHRRSVDILSILAAHHG